MHYTNPQALATTEWLADHLGDSKVVVLDGTSHLPTTGRDAAAEFADKHIPGAMRFDIDLVSDQTATLPHMLPSPERFAELVGAMGITNDSQVVVYDVYGLQSAARTWWMFRVFGHDKVAVLDGGLPKWEAEGRPLSTEQCSPATASFEAGFRPELVRSIDDLLTNVDSKAEQVIDARAAGRFSGAEPEPRAGMRSGHIPGSLSVPFTSLLAEDRTVLPAGQLKSKLGAVGVQPGDRMAATCGSGVTACVLALGCYLLGNESVAVYDGSWSEWGGRQDTPIDRDG